MFCQGWREERHDSTTRILRLPLRRPPSYRTHVSLSHLHILTVTFRADELTSRPQYIEIYRLHEVIGISLVFMAIDILGGVFSFMSLFFRDSLNIAGLVRYSLFPFRDSFILVDHRIGLIPSRCHT